MMTYYRAYDDEIPENPDAWHKRVARNILDCGAGLSPSESKFLEDMLGWEWPTPKQINWLKKLEDRALGY